MNEEAKAVGEIAKTTGKAIDAAKATGGFIAKYIGGALEQGMGIFEDKLKYLRWERQHRLILRADEFLKRSGLQVPSRAVPLKLALPILQGATLEEDDDLQDRWAALLVNAANASFPGEIRRAYASMLEQLTSLDVRILDVIYSLPFFDGMEHGVTTDALPDSAELMTASYAQIASRPQEEIEVSLANLARLGCIRPSLTYGGGEIFSRVVPTFAGREFVNACRIPAPPQTA
ncbi:hypothetical protein ABIC33_003198 [Variovorax sp. 1140]|uniref:Abi-alpha family protein n=1 Tax=Variovorax atrisoli TaxID=3394203 RepID=UPI003399AABD